MSRFYGAVQGHAKTRATRRGGPQSGLVTHAASWAGAVRCTVYAQGDVDMVRVELCPWQGHGASKVLYEGRIDGGKP